MFGASMYLCARVLADTLERLALARTCIGWFRRGHLVGSGRVHTHTARPLFLWSRCAFFLSFFFAKRAALARVHRFCRWQQSCLFPVCFGCGATVSLFALPVYFCPPRLSRTYGPKTDTATVAVALRLLSFSFWRRSYDKRAFSIECRHRGANVRVPPLPVARSFRPLPALTGRKKKRQQSPCDSGLGGLPCTHTNTHAGETGSAPSLCVFFFHFPCLVFIASFFYFFHFPFHKNLHIRVVCLSFFCFVHFMATPKKKRQTMNKPNRNRFKKKRERRGDTSVRTRLHLKKKERDTCTQTRQSQAVIGLSLASRVMALHDGGGQSSAPLGFGSVEIFTRVGVDGRAVVWVGPVAIRRPPLTRSVGGRAL